MLILLESTLISIRTGSKWISWSGTIAFRLFHFWFWTRFLFVSCLGEMFIVFFISICIFSENFSFMEFFSFFDYLCVWESIIIYCPLFRQMNALWAFCAIGFTSKKQIWMSWVLITRRLISLLISLSQYGLAKAHNWIIYPGTESLMQTLYKL